MISLKDRIKIREKIGPPTPFGNIYGGPYSQIYLMPQFNKQIMTAWVLKGDVHRKMIELSSRAMLEGYLSLETNDIT